MVATSFMIRRGLSYMAYSEATEISEINSDDNNMVTLHDETNAAAKPGSFHYQCNFSQTQRLTDTQLACGSVGLREPAGKAYGGEGNSHGDLQKNIFFFARKKLINCKKLAFFYLFHICK